MANTAITLDLDVSRALDGTQQVTGALGGLDKTLTALGHKLTAVLAGAALTGYLTDAVKAAGKLDKELLVMRLALGKLRVAIGEAFTPIAQVVVPAINEMIFGAIRFVRYMGKIIAALFGVQEGSQDAADTQNALTAATEAARKSLAGFDRINRLDTAQKKTATPETQKPNATNPDTEVGVDVNLELDLEQFLVVQTIRQMLEPLGKINLEPLRASLERLQKALLPFTQTLFAGLNWAWENLFLPMTQWSAEQLLPVFLDTLAAATQALGNTIQACRPAMEYLWKNFLQPVAAWTGQAVLEGLQWLRSRLDAVSAWMGENEVTVEQLLAVAASAAVALGVLNGALELFSLRGSTGIGATNLFGSALSALQSPFGLVIGLVAALTAGVVLLITHWDQVSAAAKWAWEGIASVWRGVSVWFQMYVLDPLWEGFRSTINGIIGFFNGLISGVAAGMNALVRAVNKLHFTVPDWIPGIGGERLGFNLQSMKAPTIPYLAQGAVLPANKPFLAVVGDQRNGTNVEAPLSTIQQAVSLVMEDMIASNLAGQEAVIGVLRQILEAVLGISIGDGDIAKAVERYSSKMAVVNGGLF